MNTNYIVLDKFFNKIGYKKKKTATADNMWASTTSSKLKSFSAEMENLQIRTGRGGTGKPSDPDRKEPNFDRIEADRLLQAYAKDPVVQSGVLYRVKSVMAPGWFIHAEDQEVKKFFSDWAKKVRLNLFLMKGTNHTLLYGNGFWKLIWNQPRDEVLQLQMIDRALIDFKRDRQNLLPVTDAMGMPTTYVIMNNLGQGKEIDVENIAHFRLHELGTASMAMGIVEPIYKQTIIKLNIEETLGQSAYRMGSPFISIAVGDKEKMPNPAPQDIDAAHDAFKDFNYKTDVAHPWFWKINVIQVGTGELESLRSNLDYFIEQQVSGMSVPKAYVTGTGGKEGRGNIVNALEQDAQKESNIIQRDILSETIRTQIFEPMAKAQGFKEVPELRWNPINRESVTLTIDNIAKSLNLGLIEPTNEVKRHIHQLLDLPFPERIEAELIKNALSKRKKTN